MTAFCIVNLLAASTLNMAGGDMSWYQNMLLLPAEGGVPGLPGGGVEAMKVDCIATFGPTTVAGMYQFHGRGLLQYELYTKE